MLLTICFNKKRKKKEITPAATLQKQTKKGIVNQQKTAEAPKPSLPAAKIGIKESEEKTAISVRMSDSRRTNVTEDDEEEEFLGDDTMSEVTSRRMPEVDLTEQFYKYSNGVMVRETGDRKSVV